MSNMHEKASRPFRERSGLLLFPFGGFPRVWFCGSSVLLIVVWRDVRRLFFYFLYFMGVI